MINLIYNKSFSDSPIVQWCYSQASSSGAIVKLKRNTNCRTQNVVYLISCGKCRKQYVGETKGPLNIRMNGHRDDWRHKRFERSPVAEHFCLPEHDFISHASVCCLDHNSEWTEEIKKTRQKSRELLDPSSKHSESHWYQQSRLIPLKPWSFIASLPTYSNYIHFSARYTILAWPSFVAVYLLTIRLFSSTIGSLCLSSICSGVSMNRIQTRPHTATPFCRSLTFEVYVSNKGIFILLLM